MSDEHLRKTAEGQEDALTTATRSRHLVRVEANLLRLPLFALSTKNLARRTGIRCTGEYERAGVRYTFEFKATRNTATPFPGPLSRSIHFALLDVLTERGNPFRNPVEWSWYDLCRRMRVKKSGQIIGRMKEAIQATAGLVIWSNNAIYLKAGGEPLSTTEEGQAIYQKYTFTRQSAGTGRTSDANRLWLADWYIDNLNALYSCPLNFDLWLALDAIGPIASRLYELLFYRFRRSVDSLQFNYRTLTNLLPANEERYRSLAEKQFNPAFGHLVAAGVVRGFEWADSKDDIGKVIFHRGRLLDLPGDGAASDDTEGLALDTVRVETLTGRGTDEEDIVADFYKHWLNQPERKPTKEELKYARELLERHGKTKARTLIPIVAELLRKNWPDAKTFGAVRSYLDDALAQLNRAEARRAELEEQRRKSREEREQKRRDEIDRQRLLAEWNALPADQQDAIRQSVIAKHPAIAERKSFLLGLCLAELKDRLAESGGE